MKLTAWIFLVVLGGLLALGGAGCHKQGGSGPLEKPKTLEEGMTQLQAALATASPQAQSNFYNGVATGIRYGDQAKATAALQQIAGDPSLNDQQKKLVGDVIELLNQAKPTAAPPGH
jgi:hypothetical protein